MGGMACVGVPYKTHQNSRQQPKTDLSKQQPQPIEYGQAIETCHLPPNAVTASPATTAAVIPLDLTDFKRDLSELTDRLGQAQDCL